MGTDVRGSEHWVLFLRGINVGSHHRVPMAELRTLLTDSGYADVTTHLQSGNVIVAAADESETVLARRTQTKLRRRFGFEIPVIVRSSAALADVLAADPLGEVATDPARYIVTFLDSKPSAAAVRALELEDFDAEQFTVRGREVYQWCPGGQHKSPLVKALDKAGITATGTARNWRTVQRLAEMVRPNR